jgi:hypothetical protein
MGTVRGVQQLGCLFLCGAGAWAQGEAQKVVVDVEGLRYPRIAASARLGGDVVFEVSNAGLKPTTAAHPILTEAARKNLETWTLPPLKSGRYLVSYHFELLEDGVKRKTVPIGGRFGRFFRHLVGAPTTTVVNTCYPAGDPTANPPPRYTLVKDGDVKIDVFVGTFPKCFQTQTSQIARNSNL